MQGAGRVSDTGSRGQGGRGWQRASRRETQQAAMQAAGRKQRAMVALPFLEEFLGTQRERNGFIYRLDIGPVYPIRKP